MRAVTCSCGRLRVVRWDSNAGIDGSYIYVCSDAGTVELKAEYNQPPGRVVTDLAESRS